MKGFHRVKVFSIRPGEGEIVLPSGWKPFAAFPHYMYEDSFIVIARKWERIEEKDSRGFRWEAKKSDEAKESSGNASG